MGNVLAVTDDNFQAEVLQSDRPVLVDFWAPWCAPCRMITPVIEQLSTEMAGQVKIVKINVDESAVAANYGVSSIPTLMIFKDGDVVDRMVGVQPKSRLQQALNEAIG